MKNLLTLLLLLTLSLTALPQSRGKGNQKKKPPQPPIVVTGALAKSQWDLQIGNFETHQYEVGTLTQEANGALSFDFPSWPRVLGKLTRRNMGALYGNLYFTVQITTTGSPQFVRAPEEGNTCDTPANFRAYVEGPTWAEPPYDYKRWWSNPQAVQLSGPLTVSMVVPIQGDQWSSVFGEFGNANNTASMMFQQTMNSPGAVGFTFGAGCFFGHGLYIQDGTAKFTLTDFRSGF